MPTHGSKMNEALKVISQGTITQTWTTNTAQDFTAGTEKLLGGVSTVLLASANDEVINWMKLMFVVFPDNQVANFALYQWWLIKQKTTDALPNFDSANFEYDRLIRNGQVLGRSKDIVAVGNDAYTNHRCITVEKYNIRLQKGEELRLVIRPLNTIADGVYEFTALEYRLAGRVAE